VHSPCAAAGAGLAVLARAAALGVCMKPGTILRAACTGLAVALAACTSPGGHAPSAAGEPAGGHAMVISVGSFDFSESVLLAEIYGQALAAARFPVRIVPNLGPREVVDPALMDGLLQVVPEYAGSALGSSAWAGSPPPVMPRLSTGHSPTRSRAADWWRRARPSHRTPTRSRFARSKGGRAFPSGAVSAGSNPTGGTGQRHKFEHSNNLDPPKCQPRDLGKRRSVPDLSPEPPPGSRTPAAESLVGCQNCAACCGLGFKRPARIR
jgi:Substrate binding domain of ABC-type glycine betaine transport system